MQTMRKNRAQCYCEKCVAERSLDLWDNITRPLIVIGMVVVVVSMSGCVASLWNAL